MKEEVNLKPSTKALPNYDKLQLKILLLFQIPFLGSRLFIFSQTKSSNKCYIHFKLLFRYLFKISGILSGVNRP